MPRRQWARGRASQPPPRCCALPRALKSPRSRERRTGVQDGARTGSQEGAGRQEEPAEDIPGAGLQVMVACASDWQAACSALRLPSQATPPVEHVTEARAFPCALQLSSTRCGDTCTRACRPLAPCAQVPTQSPAGPPRCTPPLRAVSHCPCHICAGPLVQLAAAGGARSRRPGSHAGVRLWTLVPPGLGLRVR